MLVLIICSIVFCFASGQPQPHPPGDQAAGFRPQCPHNQQWFQCGPPCGDRSCSKLDFQCNSQQCGRAGCYCQRGYVRDDRSRTCVPERSCPPRCPANEEFDRCGDECELPCPQSLHDASNPPVCHRQGCRRPACVCQRGYYREKGTCVKLEQCPQICASNEYYNNCGRGCEETCQDYAFGRQKECSFVCGSPACHCKAGFYRTRGGLCVRPTVCLNCNRNEVVDDCAGPERCQEHCDGRRFGRECPRDQRCQRGCVCTNGYVRNNDGDCVPRDRCPPRWPPRGPPGGGHPGPWDGGHPGNPRKVMKISE